MVLFCLTISGYTGKSLLYINSSYLMNSYIFLVLCAWRICSLTIVTIMCQMKLPQLCCLAEASNLTLSFLLYMERIIYYLYRSLTAQLSYFQPLKGLKHC